MDHTEPPQHTVEIANAANVANRFGTLNDPFYANRLVKRQPHGTPDKTLAGLTPVDSDLPGCLTVPPNANRIHER